MQTWASFNAELDADSRRPRRIAVAVIAAVTIARIALALLTPAPDLGADAQGYDDAARRLLRTGTYAWVHAEHDVTNPAPNAQQLPGYPVFLAALLAVPGGDSPSMPLVAVVQAMLAGLTLWGLHLLGRRLAGPAAGLVTTVLGACYAPFWLAFRYPLTEELFLALCVWAAVSLTCALDSTGPGSTRTYALTGALLSAATYVRAVSAVWALLAAGALLATSPHPHRTEVLKGVAVVALAVTLCFAPWWYRNARIYDRFVPLTTMTAATWLVGTLEDPVERVTVLDSLDVGHVEPADERSYNEMIGALAADRRSELLHTNAAGYVWRKLRALGISVLTYHPNPFGGFTGIGGLVEITHLSLLGLAALGWWRHRHNQLALVLLMLPVALVLVHGPTLSFSRYFYPMMGFVTVMAGVGLRTLAPARPHR